MSQTPDLPDGTDVVDEPAQIPLADPQVTDAHHDPYNDPITPAAPPEQEVGAG